MLSTLHDWTKALGESTDVDVAFLTQARLSKGRPSKNLFSSFKLLTLIIKLLIGEELDHK